MNYLRLLPLTPLLTNCFYWKSAEARESISYTTVYTIHVWIQVNPPPQITRPQTFDDDDDDDDDDDIKV